jgi:putative salt-induced outer membrane protein YdiY
MLLCWLFAFAVEAAADDLVVLTSGNRMTGTLRELNRGDLSFSIDGAGRGRGRIDIDWRNVSMLESTQRLDVETASGERFLGTITAPAPGILEITTDAGPKNISMKDIVRITPIEATFRDRTRGSLDVGLDFLSADDEIDWTLNAEARNRTKHHLIEVSLSSLVRRHDSETTQQRNDLQIGYRRFLENRWFALGLFEVEEDLELDLDLRALLGAAMGRTLVQSDRAQLAVYGGLDLVHEEYRGASSLDEDRVEALGAVEWDWFDLGADTTFSIEATTYVALDDGRVRLELDSSLRRDVANNVYLSLNLFESYNSDPPEGLKESDLGVSLTIGRTF